MTNGIGTRRRVIVDLSHCGRHMTGLERIAAELFCAEALAPLPVKAVEATGAGGMVRAQTFRLPAMALADRRALFLCPGFPPSPLLTLVGGDRVIPYIHDLFLLTRREDLNPRARLYMALPFRLALRRLPRFFANSATTAANLRPFIRRDAAVQLYRPTVKNVFDLRPSAPREAAGPLRLIAIGTIEPRKNLGAAVAVLQAVRRQVDPAATLDIVGRAGWGVNVAALARNPGVTVHGYLPADRMRELVQASDILLSTSHDEGLGLPLLEAQYGGLAVVAPDQPVFREVLAGSGRFIRPDDPERAASVIGDLVQGADWRGKARASAAANIARWNTLAERDRVGVIDLLDRLAAAGSPLSPAMAAHS